VRSKRCAGPVLAGSLRADHRNEPYAGSSWAFPSRANEEASTELRSPVAVTR
jgi:hypothetical protein